VKRSSQHTNAFCPSPSRKRASASPSFWLYLRLRFGQLSFAGLLCIIPVASFVRLLIVASSVSQLWSHNVRALRPSVRSFLKQAVELLSVEILAMVYFRSDTFLVARMDGLAITGIYQITYKIFDLCISLFAGFSAGCVSEDGQG